MHSSINPSLFFISFEALFKIEYGVFYKFNLGFDLGDVDIVGYGEVGLSKQRERRRSGQTAKNSGLV